MSTPSASPSAPSCASPAPTPSATSGAPTSSLDRLEAACVLSTAKRLHRRVGARFPDRHLHEVAGELVDLVGSVTSESRGIRRQRHTAAWLSRIGIVLVVAATVLVFMLLGLDARDRGVDARSFDWLGVIESGINDLVFATLAVWFLHAAPGRVVRRHTLALLHRMRSLAHIIDMHQLDKDPERLRHDYRRTAESPDPIDLTAAELEYYLNYCTELLSLVGKAAALCAESSDDPVVLDTVAGIEDLTTGMSRKIWQKIDQLNRARAHRLES